MVKPSSHSDKSQEKPLVDPTVPSLTDKRTVKLIEDVANNSKTFVSDVETFPPDDADTTLQDLVDSGPRFSSEEKSVSHPVSVARIPHSALCTCSSLEEHRASCSTADDAECLGHAEECMNLLQEVKTSTQNAVDVLNDILNYDKIERRDLALDITVIPTWDLISRVVNEFRLPATNKQISLDWSIEIEPEGSDEDRAVKSIDALPAAIKHLSLMGDESRLKQVLRNLVSNAIKFTPTGGSIHVHGLVKELSDRTRWSHSSKKQKRDTYASVRTTTAVGD